MMKMNTFAGLCLAGVSALAIGFVAAVGGAQAQTTANDAKLDAAFVQAAKSKAMLRLLLQRFPKGGDLHNHAGGTMYAEDWIAWGAENGDCYSKTLKALTAGPCDGASTVPLKGLGERDADLYSDVIDAISTRRFEQGVGDPEISGHRRFFHRRFQGIRQDNGKIIATAREHASRDKVLYVELQQGVNSGAPVIQASTAQAWDEAAMEARLAALAPMIAQTLPLAKQEVDDVERYAYDFNACGTAAPKPGCEVTTRYLMTMLRESQPATVFGQMAFAFAFVQADPRYVGINIAQPEDYPVSTRDYALHMRMFKFFKAKYPDVPLALHAGELDLGLTAPRDLRSHITEAVDVAGARRIGHGVSVAFEDNADALLARMAREKITVEINLTSNDVILGVKGAKHPLPVYIAAGVPVALSTDDMGVSRHDMTQEYVRAASEYGLKYTQLRKISRDSLTYSFLEGESLWGADGRMYAACGKAAATPAPACDAFLKTSAKAREQYKLELALADYEAGLAKTFIAIPPSKLTVRTN